MLKKIAIFFVLLIQILFINISFADAKSDAEKSAAETAAADAARNSICEKSGTCIDKPNFTISVNDISPGLDVTKGQSTVQNVNFALGTIIQTLMIALGSLSLLIMTVGAGYIVMHHGQDELLSKGKAIFLSGVYAMVVALSSYYLISIVRYILYT